MVVVVVGPTAAPLTRIVTFVIVTFFVGAPSPLDGASFSIFWAFFSPAVTDPNRA